MNRTLKLSFALLCMASFFLGGCVPPAPTEQVEKPVVMVQVQPPPVPPSPEELESPPNVVLDKPKRDPFISLAAPGGNAPSPKKKGAQAGGVPGKKEFVVTGILTGGGRNSAVLQMGDNSYIIHSGDMVAGYVVRMITSNSVVLARGKQTLTVTYFPR